MKVRNLQRRASHPDSTGRTLQIKPRNPLVAPAIMRKAGSHQKSVKAQRQQEQRKLRKILKHSSED